jgi:hypothetical protein
MVKSRKKKMPNHPWVMAAMFCQTTLEEKDNVLSAIRIVDRFTIQHPADWDKKTPLTMIIHGLLGFKSGDVKGERKIRIFGISPKGKRKKVQELAVVFMGGDTGVNVRLNMGFGVRTPGVHWLEVYVDNWPATRMPLTVVLEPLASPTEEGGKPAEEKKQSLE